MPENPRIEELRRRVQADPASIAFAALAEEYRRIGRYEDAIQACRTGLLRHPAYLSARVTLGRALIETGELGAARAELEMVLRSAPENIAALRGLEQIKEKLGESTEMAPEVAALAGPPGRTAPPAKAQEPARAEKVLAPAVNLVSFDLPLAAPQAGPAPSPSVDETFDTFVATLDKTIAIPESLTVVEPAAEPVTITLDPAADREDEEVHAEAPSEVEAAVESAVEPQVAATLIRLERFLGAIQTARQA